MGVNTGFFMPRNPAEVGAMGRALQGTHDAALASLGAPSNRTQNFESYIAAFPVSADCWRRNIESSLMQYLVDSFELLNRQFSLSA
jgi:hypothetical protein